MTNPTLSQLFSTFISHQQEIDIYDKSIEFEVTFGTRQKRKISRHEFENVIRVLKSNGFVSEVDDEKHLLRVSCSFYNTKRRTEQMSSVRAEVEGMKNIQTLCQNESTIEHLYHTNHIHFTNKFPLLGKQSFANMDNFNCRASIKKECQASAENVANILFDWKTSHKHCRFLHRLTFYHTDFPLQIDMSIVKSHSKDISSVTIQGTHVFDNTDHYEIEIEFLPNKMDIFDSPSIAKSLGQIKHAMKLILCGLQNTNYPISYDEINSVRRSYKKMVWEKEDVDDDCFYKKAHFIGPSSISLQLSDLSLIQSDFVVTEKADGVRSLLYISNEGKLYFINNSMNISFTGVVVSTLFSSLLDGELISCNQETIFAAFDIYYLNKEDIRHYEFFACSDEESIILGKRRRYDLLQDTIHQLQEHGKCIISSSSSVQFVCKQFYPQREEESIYDGCRTVFNAKYIYKIDGLIFTHTKFGVGADEVDVAGEKKNIVWKQSFKWKPPEFNTIDFLVKCHSSSALNCRQQIELQCGYNEKERLLINPFHSILHPSSVTPYSPFRFFPLDPEDLTAGITTMTLSSCDQTMRTEEDEVFMDNTIVEFSYDVYERKWTPLRLRHDKTSDYQHGQREYGNSFATACSNWKSIHFPVTKAMLMGVKEEQPNVLRHEIKDVYYNNSSQVHDTKQMKLFHNLVKHHLLQLVAKPQYILMDMACGKGGDMHKWIDCQLSFVLGIDCCEDNLFNRENGAYARYVLEKKKNVGLKTEILFIKGNLTNNIHDGSAFYGNNDDIHRAISNTIFLKDKEDVIKPLFLQKYHSVGVRGSDIATCHFALHYFFQNAQTLQQFMINLSQCTKLHGYFIGTCYDGRKVFNLLQHQSTKTIKSSSGKVVLQIDKLYENDRPFENNSSSLGFEINVYQESIHQTIAEYLVHFDYLQHVLQQYGFSVVKIGTFEEMRTHLEFLTMRLYEEEISFLNNYFIFQKTENIIISPFLLGSVLN